MLTSNVKYIMDVKQISIEKLAEKAKISSNTIVRARSSSLIKTCSLGTLEKIAEALECSPKKLYEYEKQKENTKAHRYK